MPLESSLPTLYSGGGYEADVESNYSGEASSTTYELDAEEVDEVPDRDRIYSADVEQFFHDAVNAADEAENLSNRISKLEMSIRDLWWNVEDQERYCATPNTTPMLLIKPAMICWMKGRIISGRTPGFVLRFGSYDPVFMSIDQPAGTETVPFTDIRRLQAPRNDPEL